jgi:hypothetical protein
MSSKSNQQGRALEFALVAELKKQLPSQVLVTRQAAESQLRDLEHYQGLTPEMQHKFAKFSHKIYEWLEHKFSLSSCKNLEISRPNDLSGTQGNVTDIHLKIDNLKEVNLSIKHRNNALKHQRPRTTPLHCGYSKSSQQYQDFCQQYQYLIKQFQKLSYVGQKFADLPDNTKFEYLYKPICNLVTNFINNNIQEQEKANCLFKFLIGTTNYYKINYESHKEIVSIEEFAELPLATSVTATCNEQYVYLVFTLSSAHQWKISMRLHNASSTIRKSPDLKFDTKALEINVLKEEIRIDADLIEQN